MKRSIIISLALSFFVACSGGKPTETKAPAQIAPTPAALQAYTSPEAKIGDRVICPSTGDAFEVTASSPFSTIKGKKVYYCCADCKKPVEKDPDNYLKTGTNAAAKPMGHS